MSASLAFVFPGQGSQSLGMLAELGAQQAIVRDTFAEASAVLGYDLWALTQEGPEDQLNQTGKTQPDRKSTRLNSSHVKISYAVFCLKKKNRTSRLPLTTS